MMEDLDPENARAIIDPALTLMMDAVHRYDGYVVQSTRDGIFALFGAPLAHEDHPHRALYAPHRHEPELAEPREVTFLAHAIVVTSGMEPRLQSARSLTVARRV